MPGSHRSSVATLLIGLALLMGAQARSESTEESLKRLHEGMQENRSKIRSGIGEIHLQRFYYDYDADESGVLSATDDYRYQCVFSIPEDFFRVDVLGKHVSIVVPEEEKVVTAGNEFLLLNFAEKNSVVQHGDKEMLDYVYPEHAYLVNERGKSPGLDHFPFGLHLFDFGMTVRTYRPESFDVLMARNPRCKVIQRTDTGKNLVEVTSSWSASNLPSGFMNQWVLIFSPDEGFMLIRWEVNVIHDDGYISHQESTTCEPARIDGVWFPARIVKDSFYHGDPDRILVREEYLLSFDLNHNFSIEDYALVPRGMSNPE